MVILIGGKELVYQLVLVVHQVQVDLVEIMQHQLIHKVLGLHKEQTKHKIQ